MKRNYVIENASTQDIPALIALLAILFGIEADFQADVAKQKKGLALLINHPENGVIKVAKNQTGQVIGMVSAQLVISTAQGSTSAWIEDMVIEEAYRGEGLGRALLDEALVWAKNKGATRAQLLVDTNNTPALGYYSHLGWESTQLQARKIFL
ncbi:MAG: GNAT family N-acetyltransferase [Methylophilaceae bacterium]|jgi:ribosomal protein S18 acetylase RimI-like enzyme|nr:GNAT family N-acetyltransferase [Methylophilaceae bacterium]